VRDEHAIAKVLSDLREQFGPLNVLVNNAGIGAICERTSQVCPADWDAHLAVGVKGVFLLTKHALPQMLEAGAGSIINISSIYGLVGTIDHPPYHASKGAVRLMGKTDAMLYASRGIRVNTIHPGYILTPLMQTVVNDPDHMEAVAAMHPLGHLGEPDDVAHAVVYLASDESKFITGAELVIDGGYTAR
jgi:NAD(P)-dependent dehydrogenase (short-subunit alcohol dehydrogenase family)